MFYTFYSYRGGVGRSMALSNIAVLLHRSGLNVVVADYDLEAPALETYLFSGGDDSAGSRSGLVDLIHSFKNAISQPPSTRRDADWLSLPDIEDYLHLVDSNEKSFIKLMPAGKRLGDAFKVYSETVCRFDWEDFYQNWEGELFFKWLKLGLRKTGADVVLINSCAGIAEMGRICTRLADAVVLFCPSNRQSLAGTLKLAFDLTGAHHEERDRETVVKWAEEAAGQGRPRLIVVPSRVEEGDDAAILLESFHKEFVNDFEPFLPQDKRGREREYFWELRVPYVPAFSFVEQIAARAEGMAESRRMVQAYTGLLSAMARFAPAGSPLGQLCEDKPPAVSALPGEIEGLEPYRHLSPFFEKHARLFFGRSEYIEQLTKEVARGGMIAIVGQSGSGKSSLVYAGLLSRVRAGHLQGSEHWRIIILTPDIHPIDKLADEFCRQRLGPGVEPLGEPVELAQMLEQKPGSLALVVSRFLHHLPDTARLLMVVDQLEELVTLSAPAERSAFLQQLIDAVRAGQLIVVFTMRQDFYDEFMKEHPDFAAAVGNRVLRLGRMEQPGLREAVTKPAELMGLTFEPGLVDRILEDVGEEPGNLPLLQVALTKLWQGRDGARLTHHVYATIGGVKGAIAAEAEKVYESLEPEEQEITKRIFTHLVQLSENGPNTRRRATYAELGEVARPIVKKLADTRLLVAGGEDSGSAHEDSRADQVEVAHEALIQNWPRIAGWLKDDRDFLLWRQKLWRAVADWKDTGEDNDALLRGQLLRNAEEQLSKREADLSEPVKDFIARSAAYQWEQRRIQEEQRHAQEKRSRDRVIVAVIAMLLILVTLSYMWWESRKTQNVVDASTYFIRGSEFEQAGNVDAALENYGKAIEFSPELPDPYLARAFVYSQRGDHQQAISNQRDDYQKAISDFDKFLSLKPDSAIAYNGRGEVYRKMSVENEQLRENALRDFTNATRADTSFATAWYNAALMLLASEKLDEAINAFDQAIATGPDFNKTRASTRAVPVRIPYLFNDRGMAYYQRWKVSNKSPEDIQQAVADFKQAIAVDPFFAEPYFNLGTVSTDANELTKAIEFYSQAIELDPEYGEAYNALGEAREKLKPQEVALDDFINAVKRGYQPALFNLARAYLRRGDIQEAINTFDRALAYRHDDPRAYLGRGEAYARKGEHTQAIEDFNRAIELDPKLIDAYFSRGVSYDEMNDASHAIADLRKFAEELKHSETPQQYSSQEYMQKLYEARMRLTKLGYKNLPADAKVSLHYADPSNITLARQVENALRRDGFRDVTSSQSVSRDNAPLVKFFNRADTDNAFRVRDEVNRIYAASGNQRNFRLRLMPSSAGKGDTFGLIEIWLPSPAPSVAPPPAVPAPSPEN